MSTYVKNFPQVELDGVKLTKKEAQCLYYVTRGMSARLIGETVYRSYRTIENHIANIKAKLGCHTKAELVSRAWDSNFFDLLYPRTPEAA